MPVKSGPSAGFPVLLSVSRYEIVYLVLSGFLRKKKTFLMAFSILLRYKVNFKAKTIYK